MRLLCLTSWFPPHHFGGYERSCHDVMTRLAERGHHVEVLTSDHRHPTAEDESCAPIGTVHRSLQLYHRDGALWSPSPFQRARVEWANQRALAAALDSARPDVVAVWHVGAMSIGLLTTIERRGIPMVHAVSDDWPLYALRLDAWHRAVSRRAVRPLARMASAVTGIPVDPPRLHDDGFCFISETTRQRCMLGAPWVIGRWGVVYSGFDFDHFNQAARHTRDDWHGQLLHVGRIDARKGLPTLVQALRQLPNMTLVVDGRATAGQEETLRAWVEEAGVTDRVRLQHSSRLELPATYARADACVFASEWEEPFGLVPLEAMATGTPVIATGVGGSGEFLWDDVNSVLFKPGDVDSLVAVVAHLSKDAVLRNRLSVESVATAEFFDANHLADTLEGWYRAAAEKYPHGSPPSRTPPAPAG